MTALFNASIVLYKPNVAQLQSIVSLLLMSDRLLHLYLLDNSPIPTEMEWGDKRVKYVVTGTNLGYGAAHNLALRKTLEQAVPFHFVLNADISFQLGTLERMVDYMFEHSDVGSAMPHVSYPDGSTQYLCKLLPTPLDVFGRRFLPAKWMEKRNCRYELRESGYNREMNVPYLSGCFMLLRTEALLRVGLFDERFFMYPEDIDLTRRIHASYRTMFLPTEHIVHHHEKASYRSLRMLWIHASNLFLYFCKWGWLFDSERRRFNQETATQYLQ